MSARHPKTTHLRGRAPADWWYKSGSMNIGKVADPGRNSHGQGKGWGTVAGREARPCGWWL